VFGAEALDFVELDVASSARDAAKPAAEVIC
jgi:hypothetical protein